MKINKSILSGLCFSICVLLLARPSLAQETNDPPTNSETGEVMVTVSNASATAMADDAETNDRPDSETPNHVQPIVLFGQNAELKAGDTAETVVVIGGSAKIHGHVREAVVVIGGDLEIDGEVGQAAVAIFGNVHVRPKAIIHQDVVAIGGKLDLEEGAIVKGEKVNIGLPGPLANIDWLRNWFRYCVFEFRPLAPQVGFVWVIAAIFFLIYLFIAAVFPRPVQVCVDDLTRRPVTIFVIGLLTKLLAPFVYLILAATGVGLIVAPFIWVALLLCAIVGKVAVIQWLGSKIGCHFGSGVQKPLAAFLIGTVVITLLYMVPVVGLLTYTLLSVWGLGSGVSTYFARLRRETPEKNVLPTTPSASAPASPSVPPVIDPNIPTAAAEATMESPISPGTVPPIAPSIFPETSFPKANLWQRLCAALLDVILICIVVGIIHAGSFGLMVALAYFAGMWTWRGTTIGGIVLKLKVVRTDGRPLTFVVALVRGLAAAFSVVIFFIGFLWIIWDKDKQGWHDKIAGTVVIRLPHSMPLV
jgi:uncharacterized RDD family membrane protein YckC